MCDRHPRFDLARGDRAARTQPEAIQKAQRMAARQGRRFTVRKHNGPILSNLWFVQPAREDS